MSIKYVLKEWYIMQSIHILQQLYADKIAQVYHESCGSQFERIIYLVVPCVLKMYPNQAVCTMYRLFVLLVLGVLLVQKTDCDTVTSLGEAFNIGTVSLTIILHILQDTTYLRKR